MQKVGAFLIFLLSASWILAQHTHEQKESTARAEWGDFENNECIKYELVDWQKTPIASHVLKGGQLKGGFEFIDSIEVYRMVYDSDSLMVTGFFVKPKMKGQHPCVIYNRGGNRDHGQLLVGTALTKLGAIASKGYVVIASNYRGNSNSEGKEEFGGADVNDILNLIPALGQLPFADTTRLGMIGVSRGGMMGYLALKKSKKFKVMIAIGGLSDLFIMKEKRPDMESHVYEALIPDYINQKDAALSERSANKWVDEMTKETKLLILHGQKDKSCDISMARELHAQLQQQHHLHLFVEFKGDNHGISKHEKEVESIIKQWLDKYLKSSKAFDEAEDYLFIK